jgi:hypothetical protein
MKVQCPDHRSTNAIHGMQRFNFDGLIDHGASDASHCPNFFDSLGPLLEGTVGEAWSFPAGSEADVRAQTINMDAALFVPEHRIPTGTMTHPYVSQRNSSADAEISRRSHESPTFASIEIRHFSYTFPHGGLSLPPFGARPQ